MQYIYSIKFYFDICRPTVNIVHMSKQELTLKEWNFYVHNYLEIKLRVKKVKEKEILAIGEERATPCSG